MLVRNAMFRRFELAAFGRWEALGDLDKEDGWDALAWREAVLEYREEYADAAAAAGREVMGSGPAARGPELFMVEDESARTWRVRQVFQDPEGDRDWGIAAEVDLDASDAAGEPVVRVLDVGPR